MKEGKPGRWRGPHSLAWALDTDTRSFWISWPKTFISRGFCRPQCDPLLFFLFDQSTRFAHYCVKWIATLHTVLIEFFKIQREWNCSFAFQCLKTKMRQFLCLIFFCSPATTVFKGNNQSVKMSAREGERGRERGKRTRRGGSACWTTTLYFSCGPAWREGRKKSEKMSLCLWLFKERER